jgi:ATP-dependent Lhr-like helicase
LITTPESLDSQLANRPKMLRDVRAVVLDELHLYDATPRGDQLRILLNRLRRLRRYAFTKGDAATSEVQFCALSATMHDPAGVAANYFINPVLIQTKGQRAIDAEFFELRGAESLLQFFKTFKSRGIRKALAFCQKRAECEEWARSLRAHSSPFGDQVLVHHAALSAPVRRQAEEKFSRAGAALCFATSTLELGIDIGDVDLILLIGAPDDFGSFLQRIGRGNRRTKRTKVACFYRTPTEEAVFQIFVRAAGNFDTEASALLRAEKGLMFRPSVIVQQLCSYLKQTTRGELDPEHAFGLFQTPEGLPLVDKNDYDRIVRYLIEKDFFQPSPDAASRLLRAGPAWQKLYEERTLYTNMNAASESVVVIDEMTGRRLGYLDSKMSVGNIFLLGGHARRVTSTAGRRILTRAEPDTEKIRPPLQRRRWRVTPAALTRALALELGFPVPQEASAFKLVFIPPEDEEEKRVLLFHCAGEVYGKALGEMLETETGTRVVVYNEFFVEMAGEISKTRLRLTEQQSLDWLGRRWRSLETAFDLGRFQTSLPAEIRRASVIAAFDLPEFRRRFSEIEIKANVV